ncbi:hypothetical protein [Alteriqipengyuania sp. 357]
MKTPFDTVLRARRRDIDRKQIAIHAKTTRLQQIDRAREALERELAHEYRASAESWAASSEAFIRRRLSQQAHLAAQRITVAEEIKRLRQEAVAAYGARHVIENAAEAFLDDHRRQKSRAEQREADDLSAARGASAPRGGGMPVALRLASR